MNRALRALLHPRTVRVLKGKRQRGRGARAGRPVLRATARRVTRGACDLALVLDGDARAVDAHAIVITTARAAITARAGQLVLGPDAAVASAQIAVGLPPLVGAGGGGCLLIAQSRGVAAQVLASAQARGLAMAAAIVTGAEQYQRWDALVAAACESGDPRRPPPPLLIALDRELDLAALARAARLAPHALLMLSADARHAATEPGAPELEVSRLARALGWPTLRTPATLVEAARLRLAGVRATHGRALVLAEDSGAAALLSDLVDDNALSTVGPPRTRLREAGWHQRGAVVIAPRTATTAVLNASPAVDCVVMVGPPKRGRGGPNGALVMLDAADPVATVTGAALAALLATPTRAAAAGTTAGASAKRRSNRVRRSLEHPGGAPAHAARGAGAASVDPALLVELLRRYGLPGGERSQVVRSASAAGAAAREIGFPVSLRPVGPGIAAPGNPGARLRRDDALRVQAVAGVAAARQGFRDLLTACARRKPPIAVHGVEVTAAVPRETLSLRCGALMIPRAPGSSDGIALLRVSAVDGGDDSAMAPCPLAPAQANQLAARCAPNPRVRRRLARLLVRLSKLASDSVGVLSWLRVELQVPPDGDDAVAASVAAGWASR